MGNLGNLQPKLIMGEETFLLRQMQPLSKAPASKTCRVFIAAFCYVVRQINPYNPHPTTLFSNYRPIKIL